jgi:hypothetical protein
MIGFATALTREIGGSSDCHPDLFFPRWSDFTCSAPGNGSMSALAERKCRRGAGNSLVECKVETPRRAPGNEVM